MTTLIVDTRAQLYRPHLQDKTLALSFMTVAELYQRRMFVTGASGSSSDWKNSCTGT